ncbi:hypothetical protein [Gordonia aichiensis]|uniref:Uncharacterized protein n=1 Tax=Gordonia aichiensis NBRC 108223 TaxID=1220583 RepID=L7KQD3_9ACTN|nr:hypothetical protein [Gordonia aichiensis]GAC51045.1 hypothetical protein GOACH_39_00020 [Gordonia aichiensis NBRC 108223]
MPRSFKRPVRSIARSRNHVPGLLTHHITSLLLPAELSACRDLSGLFEGIGNRVECAGAAGLPGRSQPGRLWRVHGLPRTPPRIDDRRLYNRLVELRDKADIGSDISAIRVFGILAWMWGSGRSPDS